MTTLEEIYRTYGNLMFYVANQILNNRQDAEDMVHPEKTVYISHEEAGEQYMELSEAHGGHYDGGELGELNWEFLE